MKMKLQCRLLNISNSEYLAEDIILVDLPDSMDDEAITVFFNNLREELKKKHFEQVIAPLFTVELKNLDN